ncbi:hypothetical protein GCK72_022357 [Caenorhabditis remanei]|uniref:Uncharacterized protein n=1 Tax=Caenorhabditis remanei TaxID=31234 RepID=A0A6A5FTJ4_CAERE|nr:hypothetical protein GCK72_022357 [Caenorhabditis remanei]KAF1745910.1 hypothetical protein GCK72_022357 [Caenorhabditis remanei]
MEGNGPEQQSRENNETGVLIETPSVPTTHQSIEVDAVAANSLSGGNETAGEDLELDRIVIRDSIYALLINHPERAEFHIKGLAKMVAYMGNPDVSLLAPEDIFRNLKEAERAAERERLEMEKENQ